MHRLLSGGLLFACAAVLTVETVVAQGNFGQPAPDFPPGLFTDGKEYRLSDFRDKVVVLNFYEAN